MCPIAKKDSVSKEAFWHARNSMVPRRSHLDTRRSDRLFVPVGNSLSALLDGTARLTLLNRGEDYVITMPYANCKGILIGKLTMELGGKVTIVCEKTRYSADIEFKLKVRAMAIVRVTRQRSFVRSCV